MTQNDEQALKDFMLDINCLKRLDSWTDDFNLFDVLKITNAEIRHSNILAWFFDPNENHGLGDGFIKNFVQIVLSKTDSGKYNAIKLLLQNFYSFQVLRESNHMDIVLVSQEEKTAYIIENKVWSGESSHQLKDYYEKSKDEYKGFQIIYIFLTPDGREASDPENWIPVSYGEIIKSLQDSIKGVTLKEEVRLVVGNYIDAVRKNIMKEKDEELVKICNEIYNKHRAALRLIFENVSIDSSIETEVVSGILKNYDSEGKIIHTGNNRWSFYTKTMDDFLPELSNPNSSWGTTHVYWYWMEKPSDELIIHFEVGGWGRTDELKERLDALKDAAGIKKEIKQYQRQFTKKIKITEDDYEESLRSAAKSLVEATLDNERKVLAKAKARLDI